MNGNLPGSLQAKRKIDKFTLPTQKDALKYSTGPILED